MSNEERYEGTTFNRYDVLDAIQTKSTRYNLKTLGHLCKNNKTCKIAMYQDYLGNRLYSLYIDGNLKTIDGTIDRSLHRAARACSKSTMHSICPSCQKLADLGIDGVWDEMEYETEENRRDDW